MLQKYTKMHSKRVAPITVQYVERGTISLFYIQIAVFTDLPGPFCAATVNERNENSELNGQILHTLNTHPKSLIIQYTNSKFVLKALHNYLLHWFHPFQS